MVRVIFCALICLCFVKGIVCLETEGGDLLVASGAIDKLKNVSSIITFAQEATKASDMDGKRTKTLSILLKNLSPEALSPFIAELISDPRRQKSVEFLSKSYLAEPTKSIVGAELGIQANLYSNISVSGTTDPLSAPRQKLIDRIVKATQFFEIQNTSVDLVSNTMVETLNLFQPKNAKLTKEGRDLLKWGIGQLFSNDLFKNFELSIVIKAYDGFTDSELEQYAGFVESPESQWFFDQIKRGLALGLSKCTERTLKEIAVELQIHEQ